MQRLNVFVLVLIVASGVPCFAGQTAQSCQRSLTIDDRYSRLDEESPHFKLELSKLVNESLSPLLKEIFELVRGMTDEQLNGELGKLHAPYHRGLSPVGEHPRISTARFDGRYLGYFHFQDFGSTAKAVAPHTQFNWEVMRKLYLAVKVVDQFSRGLIKRAENIQIRESEMLRHFHTFGGAYNSDGSVTMEFANLTVLQSVAQLTSDPVNGMSAEQIFKDVMSPPERGPSLVVMMSILMPPDILGPYGTANYVSHPLEVSAKTGRLGFSQKFKEIQRQNREDFQNRIQQDYEFGHGCPVGHCMKGEDRPGLQYFLDAILRVYDRIGDSI